MVYVCMYVCAKYIFVDFVEFIICQTKWNHKKATNNMKILCQIRMQILRILNSSLDKIKLLIRRVSI